MLQLILIVLLLVALFIWVGHQIQAAQFRYISNNYHRYMRQMGMGNPYMPYGGMPAFGQFPQDMPANGQESPSRPILPLFVLVGVVGLAVYLYANYHPGADPYLDGTVNYVKHVTGNHPAIEEAYGQLERTTATTPVLKANLVEPAKVPVTEVEAPSFQPDFTEGFTVQMIATGSYERAEEWAKDLQGLGYDVRYQSLPTFGNVNYRILVGNAETKAELKSIKAKLVEMGFNDALVLDIERIAADGEMGVF